MSRKKPITADEAIALVEKRRQRARDYYARMREDARAFREATHPGDPSEGPGHEPSVE